MSGEMSGEMSLSHLRKVAEAATPGPWAQGMAGDKLLPEVDNRFYFGMVVLTEAGTDDGDCGLSTAAYIAAVSPDVVLALLDGAAASKRAEALAEEWESEAARFGWIGGSVFRGNAARLRAALHPDPSEVLGPRRPRVVGDVEALCELIAGPDPMLIAEDILASDWLAAHVAAARAEERERLADEVRYVREHGLPDGCDGAPESPYFEAWLRSGGNPEVRVALSSLERGDELPSEPGIGLDREDDLRPREGA